MALRLADRGTVTTGARATRGSSNRNASKSKKEESAVCACTDTCAETCGKLDWVGCACPGLPFLWRARMRLHTVYGVRHGGESIGREASLSCLKTSYDRQSVESQRPQTLIPIKRGVLAHFYTCQPDRDVGRHTCSQPRVRSIGRARPVGLWSKA